MKLFSRSNKKGLHEPKMLTAFGKTQSLTQWGKETGHDAHTIKRRIDRGMSVEDALTVERMPTRYYRPDVPTYKAFGEEHTLLEWSRIYNINRDTIDQRVNVFGWDMERALTQPPVDRFHNRKKYDFNGRIWNLLEISQEYGVPYAWLKRNVQQRGIPIDKAIRMWYHPEYIGD